MKLYTDKIFTKRPNQKMRNPKNKEQIGEYDIW
jgi:hypothetical protein